MVLRCARFARESSAMSIGLCSGSPATKYEELKANDEEARLIGNRLPQLIIITKLSLY